MDIQTQFKWRDRKGKFHKVEDMDTSYLFNTLKMIWNNVVPEQYRIEPIYLYDFGSFYTSEYMATAVSCIVNELNNRFDITPLQITWLDTMQFNAQEMKCNSQHQLYLLQ